MQSIIGWLSLLLGGALYLAQMVSTLNFELAQRLGIQENPQLTDLLPQRAERYVAYWDVIALGWFPVAGLLMIIDHQNWPILALIAAAIYVDTAGREAVKFLAFKHQGLRMGTPGQQNIFFASYFLMAGLGSAMLIISLGKVL